MLFEEGPLVKWAIRRADCVAYAARFLEEKITRMYRPRIPLTFLPNIERVPEAIPQKSDRPTACFVGRFDRRKRPELYIELARSVPEVTFLMVGRAEDAAWQRQLEEMAAPVDNLKLLGYIDKFEDNEFYDVYDSSWVFVNTASREAHPLTFFEAAGRGCAIMSFVNPDDFASEFGYWAKNEDFSEGMRYLLEDGKWRYQGKRAHEYVRRHYRFDLAAKAHTDLYATLLS
jgi:glycosyltransferase involved in cell wall biosynthesis